MIKNVVTPCHNVELIIVTRFDMYDGEVPDRIYCSFDGCENEWDAKGRQV